MLFLLNTDAVNSTSKAEEKCYRGILLANLGKVEEGITQLTEGIGSLEDKRSAHVTKVFALHSLFVFYKLTMKTDELPVKTRQEVMLCCKTNDLFSLNLFPIEKPQQKQRSVLARAEDLPLFLMLCSLFSGTVYEIKLLLNEVVEHSSSSATERMAALFDINGYSNCQQGEYNNGLDCYKMALRIRKKVLGEYEEVAESYYSIGCINFEVDELFNALAFHKKALELREKLLGEHPKTADSYFNTGCVYFQ